MSILSKYVDRRLEETQNNLMETYYSEVENMYRQMRAWRHDYRNHIQIMKSFAAADDLQSLERYLDALSDDLNTFDQVIKTGNKVTDAILNSKISLARNRKINVIAEAHIPVALTTAELDLCIILGNLFDNAIEASALLPEDQRMIRIYMNMKNTQLYISFTNKTAAKKQAKLNGRFKSTKGTDRGFGLIRIDSIVERYGGYVNRNSEDNAYTTEILLPQGFSEKTQQ